MKILVVNDDGPEAFGLSVLVECLRKRYETAQVVTVSTDRPIAGAGMGISPKCDPDKDLTKLSTNTFKMKARPADIVHLAHLEPTRFLSGGSWDLVASGVNIGRNVGMDVFHSGTTGAALVASFWYGTASFAMSQDSLDKQLIPETADKEVYKSIWALAQNFIDTTAPVPGECWNVNFPKPGKILKGYANVPVAHYSGWNIPPTSIVPRAAGGRDDVTELEKGFVTTSLLELSVNGLRV